MSDPLSQEALTARLEEEGRRRYHDHHPFHQKMHAGELSRRQIQAWVANRYYYQTRIPIKDAVLLSRSEDPAFRRSWVRRIHDHDGLADGQGGLAQWERLATGVGLDIDALRAHRDVLPGTRFACDAYVTFVRERTLLEAVASSLTEFFSPDIMARRVVAWEAHYPWIDAATLDYFRERSQRARVDSREALSFVLLHARSAQQQSACIAALLYKCDILWALLDAVSAAHPA